MRQVHRAGEKTFIDFSGKRPQLIDRRTGEEKAVEPFVGVLGAIWYTYAEAAPTQKLPDWVGAHTQPKRIAELPEDLNGRPMQELRVLRRWK